MNKREFARNLGEILKQAQDLQDALENCNISAITEDLETLKDEAEETIEGIKSEELKDQWQERVDSLDDIISRVSDLEEVFESVQDIITELESLE